MSANSSFVERRKHNRFQMQDGAFASLTCRDQTRLGLICDISRSGLALRYIAQSSGQECRTTIPFTLNIIFDAEGYYLENIPCTSVWDRQLPGESSFSELAVRKCSVQFGRLTSEQQEQLLYLIDNFARPSIPAES